MPEVIDLTKDSIGNCKFMQHAIICKYIWARSFECSAINPMSIIKCNC